jgi:hypothetical protein
MEIHFVNRPKSPNSDHQVIDVLDEQNRLIGLLRSLPKGQWSLCTDNKRQFVVHKNYSREEILQAIAAEGFKVNPVKGLPRRRKGSLKADGRDHRGTFCRWCKAGTSLNKILIELDDAALFYKVCKLLEEWHIRSRELSPITNKGIRAEVMNAHLAKVVKELDRLSCPRYVKTHAANVAKTYMRVALHRSSGDFASVSDGWHNGNFLGPGWGDHWVPDGEIIWR